MKHHLFAAVLASLSTPAFAGEPALTTENVGFVSGATYLTHAPGDSQRLFVTARSGGIHVLQDGTITPFINLSSLVSITFEGGLLGLAFHPDYQANGWFFVYYTRANGSGLTSVVARYSVSSDPDVADPHSAQLILEVDQPAANHNAGWIGFGPDGYLYIPFGDGGFSGSGGARAQDLTDQLLGKVLRLDVEGDDDYPANPVRNYAIPPTNPLVGKEGDDEIWAYGLRNPYRASFDRQTGDFWIGDVGGGSREEINFQAAGTTVERNYGWDCTEGFLCNSNGNCSCPSSAITLPIHDYNHSLGCVVTGGSVYRGCAIPGLQGTYFFADYCSNQIWSFRYDGATISSFQNRTSQLDPPTATINDIVAIGEDYYGELYIVSLGGAIWKITPLSPPADGDGDGIPDTCEQPACMADIAGANGPDGTVDALDLLLLIGQWGTPCGGTCEADITGPGGQPDGAVDALDYLALIGEWGCAAR